MRLLATSSEMFLCHLRKQLEEICCRTQVSSSRYNSVFRGGAFLAYGYMRAFVIYVWSCHDVLR